MTFKTTVPKALLAALACSLALPQPASAQGVAYPNEASRQLGECIALATSGRDRLVTVRWFATSLGLAPQVSDAIKVDRDAKDQADQEMAALFTRLFTEDCRAEAQVLMEARDGPGIQAAGGRLGQIAMQELMTDPKVLEAMMGYLAHVDPVAFETSAQ